MKLHLGPKQYDLSFLRSAAMLCFALMCLLQLRPASAQSGAAYVTPPLIGTETPEQIQGDWNAALRAQLRPLASEYLPEYPNADFSPKGIRFADDAPIPSTASPLSSIEQTVDVSLLTLPASELSPTTGIPTIPTPYYTDVTWTSDGQYLVFSAIAPGSTNYHLYIIRSNGQPIIQNGTSNQVVQLTFGNYDERYPSLLGDGDSIAYCTDQNTAGAYELVTAGFFSTNGFAVNQASATPLDSQLEARHPFYSGTQIFFSGRPVGDTSAPFDIYSVNISNGSTTVLPFTGGGVADNDNPCLSGSGILAWDSNASGFNYNPNVVAGQAPLTTSTISAGAQRNIFVAQVSGQGLEQLTTASPNFSSEHPTWTTGTTNQFTSSNYFDLFFQSNRPTPYGQPADASTYHIYYYGALTPSNIYTETSGAASPQLTQLNTSDPTGYNAALNANSVSNQFNDTQPAISALTSSNIFVAYITDRYLINHNYDNPIYPSSMHNATTLATANSQVTLGISANLTSAVTTGATVLPVTNVVGTGNTPVFFPGQTVYVDQGTDSFEAVTIQANGVNNTANASLTVSSLQFAHDAGASVIAASTTLTQAVASGQTVLPVTTVQGFIVGQTVELDRAPQGGPADTADEFVIINTITAGSSPSLTVSPLSFNHASGSAVFPTMDQEPTSVAVVGTPQAKIASEIFVSRLTDIAQPSLLTYSKGNSEAIHVISGPLYGSDGSTNYNPSLPITHYVPAGKQATFIVRMSDRQTGLGQLYLQIKDPNSFSQNSTGLEHKVFGQTHLINNVPNQFHPQLNEATLFGAGNGVQAGINVNPIQLGNQVLVLNTNTTLKQPTAPTGVQFLAQTTLRNAVPAGQTGQTGVTDLPVVSQTGFAVGQTVVIDGNSLTLKESVTVQGLGTLQAPALFVTPTLNAHASGAEVDAVNPSFATTTTILNVASTAGFKTGDEIDLGRGSGTPELVAITAIDAIDNIITVGATALAHAAGDTLVVATSITSTSGDTALNNVTMLPTPTPPPPALVPGDMIVMGTTGEEAEVVENAGSIVYVDKAIEQQPSTTQYAIGMQFYKSGTPIYKIGNANFDPFGNEIDCQAIDTNFPANTPAGDQISADPTKYHIPDFLPGSSDNGSYDDAMASSTTGTTPSYWLRMQPLPANLQDQNGGVLYYATWTTPETGSDYNIDIIAEDNSVRMPTAGSITYDQLGENWRIYDNVWGFYTLPFQQKNKILVVNDYALPQRFFTRAGSNGPSSLYGTESYWTDINNNVVAWEQFYAQTPAQQLSAAGLAPTIVLPLIANVRSGNNNTNIGDGVAQRAKLSYANADSNGGAFTQHGFFPPYMNALGVNSYYDDNMGQTSDVGSGNNVTSLPASQQYDIWRVLSRGAITTSVINGYAPTKVQTVANPLDPTKTKINTISAPDCVIWLSPYAGDTFVGAGTITDPLTQTTLEQYINLGGRLHIEGKDIGYALTGNGASNNAFYNTYLNDAYASQSYITDDAGGTDSQYVLTGAAGAGDLISNDAYNNGWTHLDFLYPNGVNNAVYQAPPSSSLIVANGYAPGGNLTNVRSDASLDCFSILTSNDVDFTSSSFMDGFNTNAATELSGTTNREAFYTNPTTGAMVSYSSFGLAAVSQTVNFWTGSAAAIPHYVVVNQRSHIAHNIVCALRTGQISGVITAVGNAAQPLANVIVTATPNNATATSHIYSAQTDGTGTYTIVGLQAGAYQISAYLAGYVPQHTSGSGTIVHGGDTATIGLSLQIATPGSLTVVVTDTNGVAIPGASVTVTSTDAGTSPPVGTTDQTGTALFSTVQAGTYSVTVTATGYTALPVAITINSGQSLTLPITMSSAPTIISGTVFVTGTNPQVPIAGATLTLTDSTGTKPLLATGSTTPITTVSGQDGSFSFTVPGGVITSPSTVYVDGSASGYSPSLPPVPITSVNEITSTLTFAGIQVPLSKVASLNVTVVDAQTGTDISGIQVTAASATATLGPLTTPASGIVSFSGIAPGTYTITAIPSSYLSAGYVSPPTYTPSQTVTVGAGGTVPVTVTLNEAIGTVAGAVTGQLSGAAISGATVTITNTSTSTTAATATTNAQGGYGPISLRAGSYTITVSATNYITSTPVAFTLANGVALTENVALAITTIHTFTAGLQMISAPYDYSGQSLASILVGDYDGTDMQSNVVATWNPLTGAYVKTPTAPADTLHVGIGYWARFGATGGALIYAGTTETSYQIVLQPGWNMIGNPFTSSISLGNLKFYDSRGQGDPNNNNSPYSFAQASGAGGLNLISPYLYTYSQSTEAYSLIALGASSGAVASTLDPYQGYWVEAFTACTLIY